MQDHKNLNEPEVAQENETVQENEAQKTMSNKKLALVFASPVLAPMALAAIVLFFMFIACGWFFVAVTFFTSAAAAAVGIVGIIGVFFNAVNGVGAVLLILGAGIASLGFIYPTFIIGKEMSKGFLILHRELMGKAKEIKEKVLKGLKEI